MVGAAIVVVLVGGRVHKDGGHQRHSKRRRVGEERPHWVVGSDRHAAILLAAAPFAGHAIVPRGRACGEA